MLGDVLDAIIYRKEVNLAKTENQPSIVNDLLPYAVPKAKLPNNTIVRRYISAKKVTKPSIKSDEKVLEDSPRSLETDFLQAAEVITPYISPPRQEQRSFNASPPQQEQSSLNAHQSVDGFTVSLDQSPIRREK